MVQEVKNVAKDDKDYPQLLKEIPDPPEKIFIKGSLESLGSTSIAIVGTRKATSLGEKTAEEFSRALAEAGITIVSGLAIGIDSAAHRGALKAEAKTVAVLGGGIDKIYPAQNENLAKQILEREGAIISEYPPGTPSYKDNFIRRNRIISGLSRAVVIIEAPEKSGALSTAGFAAEQGRSVFVVPGPINNVNYKGSHALIRDGATLVTSPQEILEDLGMANLVNFSKENVSLEGREQIIFEALKIAGVPLTLDQIIELTKLEAQVVNETLAMLIIRNIVKETETGYTI